MNTKKASDYYEYLDTYRFIAVTQVIISHWLPGYFESFKARIGVDMFFVLSGFLITENLLKQKTRISAEGGKGITAAFKTFYIRRSLRIFPIYYITIFIFLLVPVAILADNFLWYLLYAVNYMVIYQKEWPGMFSHLWSLSVEEQFYLVWPAVIFFIPFKWIGKTTLLLVLASFLYLAIFPGNIISLPACISTLCIGALLAIIKQNEAKIFTVLKYDYILLLLCCILVTFFSMNGYEAYLIQLLTAILFFYFIKILITRKNACLKLLFANTVTSFLGKISYGLYLFHNFTPWLLRNLNGTEDLYVLSGWAILPEWKSGWALFIQHWVLLIIISVLSWFIIEKPVNSIKSKFNY